MGVGLADPRILAQGLGEGRLAEASCAAQRRRDADGGAGGVHQKVADGVELAAMDELIGGRGHGAIGLRGRRWCGSGVRGLAADATDESAVRVFVVQPVAEVDDGELLEKGGKLFEIRSATQEHRDDAECLVATAT